MPASSHRPIASATSGRGGSARTTGPAKMSSSSRRLCCHGDPERRYANTRTRRPCAAPHPAHGLPCRAVRGKPAGFCDCANVCIIAKNRHFCRAGSDARRVGIKQSLILACRPHRIEPCDYRIDVLQCVGGHPAMPRWRTRPTAPEDTLRWQSAALAFAPSAGVGRNAG